MKTVVALLALSSLACSTAQALAPCNPVAQSGPVTVELVNGAGQRLETFGHGGSVWVLGAYGDRYGIRVHNNSGERVEAVVSVDGRDAIDGKPASFTKRGYLIQPWGDVTIDGFRVSDADVATFRFASVGESYAARMGNARNVGVIGVAVFRERYVPPPPRPVEPTYGWRYEDDAAGDEGLRGTARREAPSADAPSGASGAPAAEAAPTKTSRPGLGTEFGERRYSPVRSVSFERASSRPSHQIALRYNDATGLRRLGIDLACGQDDWERTTARPFQESSGYATPPPGW